MTFFTFHNLDFIVELSTCIIMSIGIDMSQIQIPFSCRIYGLGNFDLPSLSCPLACAYTCFVHRAQWLVATIPLYLVHGRFGVRS